MKLLHRCNVFVYFVNAFVEVFPDKHCLYCGKVSVFHCVPDNIKQPEVFLDLQE